MHDFNFHHEYNLVYHYVQITEKCTMLHIQNFALSAGHACLAKVCVYFWVLASEQMKMKNCRLKEKGAKL